jgi:hypothetical protein
MEEDEVERGTMNCTKCTKDEGWSLPTVPLPPLDPAIFVAAGERVAAARPDDGKVVRARAELQAAIAEAHWG